MPGELHCKTDIYHGIPGIRYCTIIDPKQRFSATVVANGGRIMSLQHNSLDVIDSHPEVIEKIPGLIGMERSRISWDQVDLGGGRCWPAPQSLFEKMVPLLDLDLGEYSLNCLDGSSIELTSPVCRETLFRIHRQIKVDKQRSNTLDIRDRVANHSSEPRLIAPWDLLQIKKPQSIRIGPLRKPPVAFKEFGDPFSTSGFITDIGNGNWRLAFLTGHEIPMFKLGFYFDASMPEGSISATFQNGAELLESFPIIKGIYPHKGAAEIFYNPFKNYVELELMGRAVIVKPGDMSDELHFKVGLLPA